MKNKNTPNSVYVNLHAWFNTLVKKKQTKKQLINLTESVKFYLRTLFLIFLIIIYCLILFPLPIINLSWKQGIFQHKTDESEESEMMMIVGMWSLVARRIYIISQFCFSFLIFLQSLTINDNSNVCANIHVDISRMRTVTYLLTSM